MHSIPNLPRRVAGAVMALLLGAITHRAQARVLDDFNAPARSGWEDTNPANIAAVKGGQQAEGKFTFTMAPLGQPFFVSSRKTSETFELREGRTLEFRADLLNGQGPDSFAIVAFIPQNPGPNSLAGYGLAKSETDILITKGINKYFYNENPTPPVKNNNVTLVLNLAVRGGNVHVTGQVLDKDDGNRVIWEKSFVDTAAADVMSDGKDDPSAPFLNVAGNFVLYLYADGGSDPAGYQVAYDNAEVFVTESAVLDDFNAPARSAWEDANPANIAAVKGGAQADGKFTFTMAPLGQPYFVSSKKTSRAFELQEGTRHEFSVDLDRGQGPDSFAILAWIPNSPGPNSLAGYGLAKSESDILITKGINKYFYNENPTPALKNENVRLNLSLTVQNGSVIVRGRVFDKSDNDAVIFDKTFVDTPAADVMSDGKDDPSAPFITAGNVVLYLYADGGSDPAGYQVVFDDLIAAAPPAAANQPPILSEIEPSAGANLLPASTRLTFRVADDAALPDSAISVTLNGVKYTTANGLTLSATTAGARTGSLGGFVADQTYAGEISVTDAGNLTRSALVHFDTFTSAVRLVEVEDYNFDGGSYFNNPVRSSEGAGADNSFTDRMGVAEIDYRDSRTAPRIQDAPYRTQDPVRMARSLDRRRPIYDENAGTYDYDVGDLAAGDWLNYTREFTPGTYEIYLREAVINLAQGESVLERVTGNPAAPEAATEVLGSFLAGTSGYTFRNIPLTDGAGLNRLKVRLSGKVTLRLRTVTADTDTGNRLLTYMAFVPVPDAGVQRPAVASLNPAANATVDSVKPTIEVTIQNRDTTVNPATVALTVNGAPATGATVTPTASGASLTYALATLPASGSTSTAVLTFKDNEGVEVRTEWQFTVRYAGLDPASRLSARGRTPGFKVRVVQAPADGGALENSLDRAENQLASGSTIPRAVDTNTVVALINFNKRAGETGGFFADDVTVPGIEPDITGNGDADFAVEIVTYLELPAGAHRFGVVTDDGYKIASSAPPVTRSTVPLAFHNGGPANETFDFVVPQSGIYAFRMLWYERAGGGHGEWFSVNTASGERTLVGDPASGIKAWSDIETIAIAVTVESSASVSGGYAPEPAAVVNETAKTATLPLGTGNRFFRLKAGSALTLRGATIQGGNIVLSWQ